MCVGPNAAWIDALSTHTYTPSLLASSLFLVCCPLSFFFLLLPFIIAAASSSPAPPYLLTTVQEARAARAYILFKIHSSFLGLLLPYLKLESDGALFQNSFFISWSFASIFEAGIR
jgi:hypothetical protein